MLMVRQRSEKISVDTLYYDWPNQRNLIISRQQSSQYDVYDLELGSGRSYYYEPALNRCKEIDFPVGILKPDWLKGARYLGVHDVGNITCNTWTKADFVVYYSDQHTGHPVRWTFLKDNMTQDVVRFHEGREAPEETWEVPRYCVNKSVALRKR